MIQRPLIVSTLVGLVYGDLNTGLLFGAQMELLSMGLVGIGAHSGMPEITLGSAVCTAFICGNGAGSDVALTLALPISTFATSIGYITWIPLNHILSEKAKNAAAKADTRTMEICQWLGLFNYFFFPFVLVVIALVAGSPLFEWLIEVIPTWITEGINVASGMLPALGFALALIVFAGIREQLSLVNIPKGMRGMSIALVTAGLLAMAFMGFSGVDKGLATLFGLN